MEDDTGAISADETHEDGEEAGRIHGDEEEREKRVRFEEESGESRDVRFKKSPSTPTKREIEQHRKNAHLPYR